MDQANRLIFQPPPETTYSLHSLDQMIFLPRTVKTVPDTSGWKGLSHQLQMFK